MRKSLIPQTSCFMKKLASFLVAGMLVSSVLSTPCWAGPKEEERKSTSPVGKADVGLLSQQTSSLNLTDLPAEVLVGITAYLDLGSTVRLNQVNTLFRRVTCDAAIFKELWAKTRLPKALTYKEDFQNSLSTPWGVLALAEHRLENSFEGEIGNLARCAVASIYGDVYHPFHPITDPKIRGRINLLMGRYAYGPLEERPGVCGGYWGQLSGVLRYQRFCNVSEALGADPYDIEVAKYGNAILRFTRTVNEAETGMSELDVFNAFTVATTSTLLSLTTREVEANYFRAALRASGWVTEAETGMTDLDAFNIFTHCNKSPYCSPQQRDTANYYRARLISLGMVSEAETGMTKLDLFKLFSIVSSSSHISQQQKDEMNYRRAMLQVGSEVSKEEMRMSDLELFKAWAAAGISVYLSPEEREEANFFKVAMRYDNRVSEAQSGMTNFNLFNACRALAISPYSAPSKCALARYIGAQLVYQEKLSKSETGMSDLKIFRAFAEVDTTASRVLPTLRSIPLNIWDEVNYLKAVMRFNNKVTEAETGMTNRDVFKAFTDAITSSYLDPQQQALATFGRASLRILKKVTEAETRMSDLEVFNAFAASTGSPYLSDQQRAQANYYKAFLRVNKKVSEEETGMSNSEVLQSLKAAVKSPHLSKGVQQQAQLLADKMEKKIKG